MSLPAIVTRVVGLWILAGAFLKLFQGSPADLPGILHDLPMELGLVFKLAISAEMAIGLLALLRPSRGWLPAKLLTGLFLIVLVTQVARGETSCGCFGSNLPITPIAMLVIDAVLFGLLVFVRPWRLQTGKGELPWAPTALVILGCLTLPWVFDREATVQDVVDGKGGWTWAQLNWDKWTGKALKDTELWALLEPAQRLEQGTIVIWSPTCEDCKQHLEILAFDREYMIVLLEMQVDAEPDEIVVKILPEGEHVQRAKLKEPETGYADLVPPIHVDVRAGKVVRVLDGTEVEGAPSLDDEGKPRPR